MPINRPNRARLGIPALAVLMLAMAGCLAGPSGPFSQADPAGFWAGLWHGFIVWLTFVLSLFSDVKIYAAHNTGWPYDLGFIMGMACCLGGGTGGACNKSRKKRSGREWDEIARKVEQKVKREMRSWAEAANGEDWDRVEKKAEQKLKRIIRDWADK